MFHAIFVNRNKSQSLDFACPCILFFSKPRSSKIHVRTSWAFPGRFDGELNNFAFVFPAFLWLRWSGRLSNDLNCRYQMSIWVLVQPLPFIANATFIRISFISKSTRVSYASSLRTSPHRKGQLSHLATSYLEIVVPPDIINKECEKTNYEDKQSAFKHYISFDSIILPNSLCSLNCFTGLVFIPFANLPSNHMTNIQHFWTGIITQTKLLNQSTFQISHCSL